MDSHKADAAETAYARDAAFWENYSKSRPKPPDALFDRICQYHAEHGGSFDVAHDAGAGIGPYSVRLKKYFRHVIVSDIVPDNVRQAEARLGGTADYSFRAVKIENADDMPEGSVDVFFCANAIHFVNDAGMQLAVARQLRSGGTFACAAFGMGAFEDDKVQSIWLRLINEGTRVALRNASNPASAAHRLQTFKRVDSGFDCVPVSDHDFEDVLRIRFATPGIPSSSTYWPATAPEEIKSGDHVESRIGPHDIVTTEEMPGWQIELGLQDFKDLWATFSFAAIEPTAYESLWKEMEGVMSDGKRVKGWWPARLILASRRRAGACGA